MRMPVVDIRKMPVTVGQRFVAVWMRVRILSIPREVVLMLVVFVVLMGMRV